MLNTLDLRSSRSFDAVTRVVTRLTLDETGDQRLGDGEDFAFGIILSPV